MVLGVPVLIQCVFVVATPYQTRIPYRPLTDNKEHVLIPVLYRKCEIPAAISPLYYCDYPRFKDDPDVDDFFWNKLYTALKQS